MAVLPTDIDAVVQQCLAEDVGSGDITAQLIDAQHDAQATVITRQTAVLCGTAWFDAVFRQLEPSVTVQWLVQDGEMLKAEQTLCKLEGNARALLTGERSALNLLQTLSGVATATRQYVDAIMGTKAKILDTRKTLPHLRQAQKYAVSCGGGQNHRMGLFDGFLIKENHLHAVGSIPQAVTQARALHPNIAVEVEVENLQQLQIALETKVDRVLLDNFSLPMLREAVKLTQGTTLLEASGGIDLQTVRAIAETGVDYISIGALTKDICAVDLSMRFAL